MTRKWTIVLYQTSADGSPVKDFIDGLDAQSKAKIYYSLELLQEFGLTVKNPHIKKLTGTELWELRILGKENIRILYITATDKVFLLLHGFKKKKNKTPMKEIHTALKRLAVHKSN